MPFVPPHRLLDPFFFFSLHFFSMFVGLFSTYIIYLLKKDNVAGARECRKKKEGHLAGRQKKGRSGTFAHGPAPYAAE